jgi:hypothetical protein
MSCQITIKNVNGRQSYKWMLQGMDMDDVMVSVPAFLATIRDLKLSDKDCYNIKISWATEHERGDSILECVRGGDIWGECEAVFGGSPERDARELLSAMLRWDGLAAALESHPAKERSKRFFTSVVGLVYSNCRGAVVLNVERFNGFPHLSDSRKISLLKKVAREMVSEGCFGRDILGGLI